MNPIEVLKSYKASWQTDGLGLRGVPTVVFESRSRVETPAQPRRASVVSLEAAPLPEPPQRPTFALDEPQERFDLPSEVPAVPGDDQPEDVMPFRPALPCCLYPATGTYGDPANDLPAQIDVVFYEPTYTPPIDAQVCTMTNNGDGTFSGEISYNGDDHYPALLQQGTFVGDFVQYRWAGSIDFGGSTVYGFAGSCLINFSRPLALPPDASGIDNNESADYFENTYSINFGSGVTATVTRVSLCKWTGTASDGRAVLLQYKQATLKWRLNGRNKDANQGSPVGAYGPWTVS